MDETLRNSRRFTGFIVVMVAFLLRARLAGMTHRRRRRSGRGVDRLANPEVRRAAADVAAHRLIDLFVGWFRTAFEQRGSRHQLASLAVSALRHVEIAPRD